MKKREQVGIAALGTYVPKNVMTAGSVADITGIPEDIVVRKLGFRQKPLPSPEETVSYMATRAAETTLDSAGLDARDIDAVIYFGGEHKDYPVWLAGPKVAHNIGADRAWSFDMSVMCGSFMGGLKVAKSMMLTDERLDTVLMVSGYRNGDFINMKDPSVRFMYNLGAAGSAALLVKGHDRNTVLETALRTDGSFSEDVIVPVGGCKGPLTEDDLRNGRFNLKVVDPSDMKHRLEKLSLDNFVGVIRDAVTWSGYDPGDIDYLAIIHMKRSAHEFILDSLNLTEKESVYLSDYGHTGQNDQIISIEEGLKQGLITDGSLVVTTGAGIGYVWAASAIKWGRAPEKG
ncbi:MAG: 3-oxoacyl-ACP synthase [Candidatus Undinarchaeales archaeon]|nr:3-oxoacyl-ACP synthase [Candidatus Undinarchaeales archaeon]MDP7491473.1 3-oxoacyl-ACP synthase [Candidatus Undinarchaeales archaeon]